MCNVFPQLRAGACAEKLSYPGREPERKVESDHDIARDGEQLVDDIASREVAPHLDAALVVDERGADVVNLIERLAPRPVDRNNRRLRHLCKGYGARVPGDTVLEARALVKDYRRARAVDGVDLVVGAGERVALLGPNGAGKTTTLLMILGAVEPDTGDVTICGHDLAHHRSAAAQQVGFAAGYLPLAERLRVTEYLTLYAQLYGVADPRERIAEGLERFRISNLGRAMGTELSSGQRTLIGIVRATLHRPRLLVLDEPTASLDPDVAQRVRTGLLELAREDGTALLMTSHDMSDVEQVCERVVFLETVAAAYGRGGLEGVFVHLAERHEATAAQQSDHP